MEYNKALSQHFTVKEFFWPQNYENVYCKATGRRYTMAEVEAIAKKTDWKISSSLLLLLETIRKEFGGVVLITPHGGYRPPELNAAVGGAAGSQHRNGCAADIKVRVGGKYIDAATLAVKAEQLMDRLRIKGGVGVYGASDNYIHVDTRGKNVSWYDSYSSSGCPGQGGRICVYRKGNKAAGVVLIQRRLKELGYEVGAIDGYYGTKTAAAVKAYQASKKLSPDGVYGFLTNKVMRVLPW